MNDTSSSDDIVLECELPDPPEKVWRALTEPELVAKWLTSRDERSKIDCEIIESEPNKRLRYSWRDSDAGGESLDSIVTFELFPTRTGGTHLRLIHGDFEITSQPIVTQAISSGAMLGGHRPATPIGGSRSLSVTTLRRRKPAMSIGDSRSVSVTTLRRRKPAMLTGGVRSLTTANSQLPVACGYLFLRTAA